MSDVETPLLAEFYASGTEVEDMRARHERELASIFSVPIGLDRPMLPEIALKRRDANAIEWYNTKQIAWNKQLGPRVKRKVVRKVKRKPKRKRKVKRKAKWVPRKTYLARLRKKRKR